MKEEIAERIQKELGVGDLSRLLADKLSGSDLHSLLLSVIKKRITGFEPRALMTPNSVTKPCDLSARELNKFETIAYETASSFDAVELSPLHPLGAVSKLTALDQANVLSTIRAFECASDPTIGLALESAMRRKNAADRKTITRLCTCHRVVRFPLPKNPAFTAHFKLFSLTSAGRDAGSFKFETAALKEHIDCYLTLLKRLTQVGFAFKEVVVEISDTRAVADLCSSFAVDREQIRSLVRARDGGSSANLLQQYSTLWPKTLSKTASGSLDELSQLGLTKPLLHQLHLLKEEVMDPLESIQSEAHFEFNLHRLTGLGYYDGPCFHIKMKNDRGEAFMLADGGFVDWTQLLLSDGKERMMTSAIGEELICRMFKRTSR